jgi:hypothetical protein
LTKCGDLSAAEVDETETAVVAVKTAEMVEVLEMVAVMLTTVVLTIKAAATLVMTTAAAVVTLIMTTAAAVVTLIMTTAAVVYRRGRWFVSNVSDVRTMWNITSPGYLNNDCPWSSV